MQQKHTHVVITYMYNETFEKTRFYGFIDHNVNKTRELDFRKVIENLDNHARNAGKEIQCN